MQEFELLTYVETVKDLEVAVYIQENLIKAREKELYSLRPTMPQKPFISPPTKPREPNHHRSNEHDDYARTFFLVALGVMGLLLYFLIVSEGEMIVSSLVVCLPIAIVSFICGGLQISKSEKMQNAEKAEYQMQMVQYESELKDYESAVEQMEYEYAAAVEKHNSDLRLFEEESIETLNPYKKALHELESSLEMLYFKDIIFPKYRSLVAIAAIYEYLSSGRCDSLEGADGAYNLYEMELRQNIIISQLSVIIDNLERIRENQYILYRELKNANEYIQHLSFCDESRDSNLAVYYSELNTMNNIAKSIALGMII